MLVLLIGINFFFSDIIQKTYRLSRAMSIISPGKIRTILKLILQYWNCISLILNDTIAISRVRFC